jgi:hypothetical protein
MSKEWWESAPLAQQDDWWKSAELADSDPVTDTGDDLDRIAKRYPKPAPAPEPSRIDSFKDDYGPEVGGLDGVPNERSVLQGREMPNNTQQRLNMGAGPISQKTVQRADALLTPGTEVVNPDRTAVKVAKNRIEAGGKSFDEQARELASNKNLDRVADGFKADEFRSAAQFMDDAVGAVAQGTVSLLQMPVSIIAPEGPLAASLRQSQKNLQADESDVMRARRSVMERDILSQEGFLDKYVATVAQLVTNPSLAISEGFKQLPMFMGVIAAAKLGGAAGAGAVAGASRASPTVALSNAISGGAITNAARAVGSTAGGIAASSTMAAGDAAGSAYDELTGLWKTQPDLFRENPDFAALVAAGRTEGQAAQEIAKSKARMAAMIAAPLGILGFAGAEAAVISRGLRQAVQGSARGRAGKVFATELVTEQLEEGGTQVAGNLGVQAINPEKNLSDNVAQAMGTALVASAPFAAVGAAASAFPQDQAGPDVGNILRQESPNAGGGIRPDATAILGAQPPGMLGAADAGIIPPDAPVVPAADERTLTAAARDQAMADIGTSTTVEGVIEAADAAVKLGGRAVQLDEEKLLNEAVQAADIADALIDPVLPDAAQTADLTADQRAAPVNFRQPNQTAPSAVVWTGRRGDGYATTEDANRALGERQRLRPNLDWSVQQNAEGRFVLNGVPQGQSIPSVGSNALGNTQGATSLQNASSAALEGNDVPVQRRPSPGTVWAKSDDGGVDGEMAAAVEELAVESGTPRAIQLVSRAETLRELDARVKSEAKRFPGGAAAQDANAILTDMEKVGDATVTAFGWRPTMIKGLPNSFGVQYDGRTYLDIRRIVRGDKAGNSVKTLAIQTIGHETTHALEYSAEPQDRADHAVLRMAVLANAKPDALAERVVDEGRDQTYGENEVVADVMGNFWLEPKFWAQVYNHDGGSTMRRIAYKFMENATKLLGAVKGKRFNNNTWINNVDAVREVAAQVWASKAKRGDSLFGNGSTNPSYSSSQIGDNGNTGANDGQQGNDQRQAGRAGSGPASVDGVRGAERADAGPVNGREAGGGVGQQNLGDGGQRRTAGDVVGGRAAQGGQANGRLTPHPGTPRLDPAKAGTSAGPDARLVATAEAYAQEIGIELRRQSAYVKVDPERAGRIAKAYEAMPHDPQNPVVREAYENLIRQTTAQYRALERAGYKFWLFGGDSDPYSGNPWAAMADLRENQSMAVYDSSDGFGTDTVFDPDGNPLLAETEVQWPYGSPNGELRTVLANDLFRAVHDAFGHGLEGSGFRFDGEENAWQAHVRLFTGSAVGAITSETRGQNSQVNFGKDGEKNRNASVFDTVFADQKTGLMPAWTSTEGRVVDMPRFSRAGQSNFEVAPDPNNEPLSAKWNALKLGDKLRISRTVADSVVPQVLALSGAKGRIVEQTGSYLSDTNPSFALQLEKGDLQTVSKQLGFVLAQDSMMNIARKPFVGGDKVGAVVIELGDKSFDEVKAIYDTLRSAVPEVGGQSFAEGDMVVLNYSDTPTDQLTSKVDEALGGQYTIRPEEFYSSFPEKKDYDYASASIDPREQSEAGPDIRQRLNRLRSEATRRIEAQLPSFSRADVAGPPELAGRPDQGRDAGKGQTVAGAVHYGRQAGLTRLSGANFGTGINGAEQERLSQATDPRIKKRVYFYLPVAGGIAQPEIGLGAHVYTADLSGLYDFSKDPIIRGKDNALESAILDAGYKGYINTEQGTAVVLDTNVPVTYQGTSDQFNKVRRTPVVAKPKQATRTEGSMLVRRPEGDEVMGVIKAQRAGLDMAAPSFKMEFGEARVLASEAEVADAVFESVEAKFRFGKPSFSKADPFEGMDFDEVIELDDESFMEDEAFLAELEAQFEASEEGSFSFGLQAELQADQNESQQAGSKPLPDAQAIASAGYAPESAFDFDGLLGPGKNPKYPSFATPQWAKPLVSDLEVRVMAKGHRVVLSTRDGAGSFVTDGLDSKAAERYIGRQIAGAHLTSQGHDLASGYRKGTLQQLASTWRAISKNAGFFKLPTATDATKVADIAADLGAFKGYDVSVSGFFDSGHIEFTRRVDAKTFSAEYRIDAGRMVCCTMGLKDAAGLGTEFYAVMGQLAQNAGVAFVADSTLSGVNTYRRTEQAMSYALKSGRTDVLQPGPQNRVYGYNAKASTTEQHDANIARLALAGLRNVEELFPGVRNLKYDPATDKFTDARGTDAEPTITKALVDKEARAFGLGRSSIARAVITNSILKGSLKASDVGTFKKPVAYSLADVALDEPMAETWGDTAGGMTPNFTRWFGASKVLDTNGKPLVMYHGTSASEDGEAFTSFDTYASSYGLMGMGGYFTADPAVASSYTTKGRGDSPTVYPVFLSIKNPIDMDAPADANLWRQQFDGIGQYHEGGTTNESWYRAAEDMLTDEGIPKYEGAEAMQDGLRNMGYDGITHMGGGRVKADGVRHRVYIGFDPEQIKSVFNSGDFNPLDRRISYSKADIEGSPNFKRWFGDSKVVDAQGKPMVIYHGRGEDFTEFNAQGGKGKTFQTGAFFSSSPDTASTYATGGAPNVAPVYLSLKNPAVIDAQGKNWNAIGQTAKVSLPKVLVPDTDESLSAELEGREPDAAATKLLKARKTNVREMFKGEWDYPDDTATTDDLARWARKQGYDGLIVNNVVDKGPSGLYANDKSREPASIFVAFKPEQIKSATGNRGSFDGTDPRISYSRANGGFDLDDETGPQKARRKTQDYFYRSRIVQEAIAKQGGSVTEQTDFYRAEELSHGRTASLLKDFAVEQLEPMMDKAVEFGIDLDEVSLYAYAKHAKERNQQILRIDPTLSGGSGMTDADANDILQLVDQMGNKAKYEELHKDLMAITKGNRDLMLSEGLITPKEYNALQNGPYKNYIPLRGFELMNDDEKPVSRSPGKGFNIRGAETLRAKGRVSRAGQLIENVVADRQRIIQRAERNHVAKVFLNFVLTNPEPELWEIDATTTRKSLDRQTGRIARNTVIEKGEDTISAKVKGREIYIRIKDPMLLRAMRKSYTDETGELTSDLMKSVGLYTSLLRNTLTRYNPEFAFVNAIRDIGFGAAAVLDVLGEKGVAKFLFHYKSAMAVSHRNERNTLDPVNPNAHKAEWSRWFLEFKAAGGTTSGFYAKGVEEINGDIRDMMIEAGATPKDWSEKVRFNKATRAAKGALRVLEWAGSVSENAARVSAYRTAREMGKTPSQAASIAKNLTTNFDRKGEYGQLLNTLFLFYNAAVQGTQRTVKMLKNPKVWGYMAGVTAASVGVALLSATVGGDDPEDGMAYWDKIPNFVKERNFIIMLPPGAQIEGAQEVGTKGRYLTIPVQYGLNIFHAIGYQVADVMRNKQDPVRGVTDMKGAINIGSALAGSFNPFGGAVDLESSSSMVQAILPTIFDFPFQLATGTNAFGRDVAPFKSPFDTGPDSQNANIRQAGGPAERLVQWVNDATGGSEYQKGIIDIAPGTAENVVRNLTGGTGVFLYDVIALGGKWAEIADGGDPDLFVVDIPILRRVTGETAGNVDQGILYERRRAIQEARSIEQGADEADVEITDPKVLALSGMSKMAGKYTKALSNIRKEMKELQRNEDLSKGEKRLQMRELRAERDRLVSDFNADFMETMRDELAPSQEIE